MYLLVLKQLTIMTIITVAGYIFARIVKVTDEQQKFMSRLLLYFINPFLVLNSFNMEFSWHKFGQLWFAAFIALVMHGIMILLGILSSKEKIDRIAVAFTNCGFVGIPLIRGVFGDEGVFYLMGYLIIFNVLIWTYGYYQVSGTTNIKKIITNPNIIAVTIGLILFCLPFKLPELIQKPIVMIADINTPMAMLLLGILFARFEFDRSYIARVIKTTLFRLVVASVCNLVVILVAYKIFANMADIKMMLFAIYICSMCPVATTIPGLAVVFDHDKSFASLIVTITSLFCILTIPTFVALGEWVMGLL
ncbi:MAG: AEC family transporter [Treponema sp.]|nr:AEC family transporter [Treponema sp.]